MLGVRTVSVMDARVAYWVKYDLFRRAETRLERSD
ncbi:hypothetical protein LINPERHAP2_LOCUS13756 [Linum perenne]